MYPETGMMSGAIRGQEEAKKDSFWESSEEARPC